MEGQPNQHAPRYMVVRSDSDGQLHHFESVTAHQPQMQAPLYQTRPPPPQQGQARSYTSSSNPSSVVPSRQPSRNSAAARSRAGSTQGGHSRAHSRNPSVPQTPTSRTRTRTNTAASSDSSITSESEFMAYRDGIHQTPHSQQQHHHHHQVYQHAPQQQQQHHRSQSSIGGFEYGPFSYLNNPANMAAERYYSQESLKMQRDGSSSASGSSHGHVYYPNQPGYIHANRGAPAPMMHAFGSSSSFDSYGSAQAGPNPYTPRSGTRVVGGTAPSSSLGHDSVQVLAQPNYAANHALETHFLYDSKNPEHDDYLHNPSTTAQHDAIIERRTCSLVSIRGFCNVVALVLIIFALIGLFGAYPVIQEAYLRQMSYMGGFRLGGRYLRDDHSQVYCGIQADIQ